MAYGNIADGDRVVDFAEDGDIDDRDFNEIQDQLATILGPAEVGLTHLCLADGAEWTYAHATDNWTSAGGAADDIVIPLPFRAGTVITEIHLAIEVATNGAGGDLKLYRQNRVPVAGAMPAPDLVATIDADIWNGLTDGDATAMDYTGLSYTMAAGYTYHLWLVARAAIVCKLHEVSVLPQRD